jgi:hypothetical protein
LIDCSQSSPRTTVLDVVKLGKFYVKNVKITSPIDHMPPASSAMLHRGWQISARAIASPIEMLGVLQNALTPSKS